MDEKNNEIVNALGLKAGTKQFMFRKTQNVFDEFKKQINAVISDISGPIRNIDKNIELSYREKGDFEAELKFSGDTLVFMMHTNIFNFPPDHAMYKTDYVRQDIMRSYCGMILIYNFLSDSIKYNRLNDMGYLTARVFINKDGHFFIQGKRQFSFLYNDFSEFEINPEAIKLIVQTAILHSIDFDLFVPPFDNVKEISLIEKVALEGNASIKTGKRLGFNYIDDIAQ